MSACDTTLHPDATPTSPAIASVRIAGRSTSSFGSDRPTMLSTTILQRSDDDGGPSPRPSIGLEGDRTSGGGVVGGVCATIESTSAVESISTEASYVKDVPN